MLWCWDGVGVRVRRGWMVEQDRGCTMKHVYGMYMVVYVLRKGWMVEQDRGCTMNQSVSTHISTS